MRIRKIKDKDIYAAATLMKHVGVHIDQDTLAQRINYFQYKRSHSVVVVDCQGQIAALMHIGVEPSLVRDRVANIYSLFIDDKQKSEITKSLLAYGENWAKQHGCDLIYGNDQ